MIGRLSGILLEKNPPQLLLDVQGVAYEVDVPMSTFYNLPGDRRARDAVHASRRARGRAPAVRLRQRQRAPRVPAAAQDQRRRRAHRAVGAVRPVGGRTRAGGDDAGDRPPHQDSGHRQEDRRAPAARAQGQARRRPHRRRSASTARRPRRATSCTRCSRWATATRRRSPRSSSCPTAWRWATASGRR